MIPWHQQVNVHARPNYVLANNLFATEPLTLNPWTSEAPYFQSIQQSSVSSVPHFQIEAQIYHHPNHDDEEFFEDQGRERGNIEQTKPRVFPVERFEPKQDAIALNKAMLGTGTNEAQIIKILTKRSLEQRLAIAEIYKEMFGSDLSRDLNLETSGNFRTLLLALLTPLYQYYAKEVRDAMVGIGTNEDVLIEIMCSLSNAEMEQVKKAYHNMFRSHLEEHIRDETSGHFKELLISLADRTDDYEVNTLKAKEQARRLHRAGELRMGTDESEFISILSTQSFVQLNEIFFQYQTMTQHDMEDVIISEFSGDLAKALRTIVKVVRNKPLYFAEGLYDAMKGLGTRNKKLIRIMVTRAELDLGDVAEAFRMKYGTKLEDFIKADTSGDYQSALLSLLGTPIQPTFRNLHDSFLVEPGARLTGATPKNLTPKQLHNLYNDTFGSVTSASKYKRKNKSNNDENRNSFTDENHKPNTKNKHKNANFTKLYHPKFVSVKSTKPTFVVTRTTKSRKSKKKQNTKNKRKNTEKKKTKKPKPKTKKPRTTKRTTKSEVVFNDVLNDYIH